MNKQLFIITDVIKGVVRQSAVRRYKNGEQTQSLGLEGEAGKTFIAK